MSNTVHGPHGTDFTVRAVAPNLIFLTSTRTTSSLSPRIGTLSIENSQHLRILLAEAEIEAKPKPKPSKAERIRALLDAQEEMLTRKPYDGVYNGYHQRTEIRRILNEDGPL